MIGHGRGKRLWIASMCFAAAMLAGCGRDGTSTAAVGPTEPNTTPSISGTIYAPNGEFASASQLWRWADAIGLWPRAFALEGVLPITTEENISVSRLDPTAAAHGCPANVACAQLIANGRSDPDTGEYVIASDALDDVGLHTGRLIVQIGNGHLLTRAFVLSRTTDIDACTEALVRLVLFRLTQAPAIQLDAFTDEGLQTLSRYAHGLTQTISADTVPDLNDAVYNRLSTSGTMQQQMDDVTGVPMTQ